MSLARASRQYLGVRALLPPDLQTAERNPTSNDKAYVKGTLWLNTSSPGAFMWPGSGSWISLGTSSSGDIVSLTGDSGGAITAVAGNIDILGDSTDGVSVVGTSGTLTINVAAASTTQRGTLETATTAEAIAGTSSIVAVAPDGLQAKVGTQTAHGVAMGNTGATSAISWSAAGTAGQAFISGGAAADGAYGTLGVDGGGTGLTTLTAHALYVGNGASAPTALAVGATGETLMGSTGADPGWTGSPSFSGSVTAGTTVTATLGAITATNGNLVLGTAGNKIVSTSVGTTTSAGANSFGSVTLASGTATVATTAVTASSLIVIWRQSVGASVALGELTVGTITPATSFVVSADTQGTPGTPLATDASVVGWMIIN